MQILLDQNFVKRVQTHCQTGKEKDLVHENDQFLGNLELADVCVVYQELRVHVNREHREDYEVDYVDFFKRVEPGALVRSLTCWHRRF